MRIEGWIGNAGERKSSTSNKHRRKHHLVLHQGLLFRQEGTSLSQRSTSTSALFELALGFESERLPLGTDRTTTAADRAGLAANGNRPPSLTGDVYQGQRHGDREVASEVGTVVRAQWPPEYILENVQQASPNTETPASGRYSSRPLPTTFPDDVGRSAFDGVREDGEERGQVVVTNANCGYLVS